MEHNSGATAVTYSPDGARIVSGGEDNTLKIWDAATGKELHTLSGHVFSINAIAYSPDGNRIASGGYEQTLRIWDAYSGDELYVLSGHTAYINALAYSPDGSRIVSAQNCIQDEFYSNKDCILKIWNTVTGAELLTLDGHTSDVTAVAYSPDGSRIVSGARDRSLKIWDAASGAELRKLNGHSGEINAVAYSPDGRYIVSGGADSRLKIWDAVTGIELRTLNGHDGSITSVAYSPDGGHIISGGLDTTPKIWDAAEGTISRTLGYNHNIRDIALSPDGRRLVSAGWKDHSLKIWDVATGLELHTLSGHKARIQTVAYSPDGKHIVSGGDDHTLKIWDATSGTERHTLGGYGGVISAVAYSPDGSHIVSNGGGNTLKIWDAVTGTELPGLSGHSGLITAVTYSPDGRRIVSGGWDDILKIWDVATGTELRTLSGHTDTVRAIAYSPDGTRIVSGSSDNTLKIWDAATGVALRTLSGHTHSINDVAYSPDGSRIVSGSWDNTLKIWDALTGNELRTLIGHKHGNGVLAVAFSPVGQRIYSGSFDRTIKVWDSGLNIMPPITLPATLALEVGASDTLLPLSGHAAFWSSSDETIASVSASGMVTAYREGNVTITAQDLDAIRAHTLVTVSSGTTTPGLGRAIIIAGGGKHVDNTLFPYTDELTRAMYKLLIKRGYRDEDIFYLTPETWQDLNGDGVNDNADGQLVDYLLSEPRAELAQAIDRIAPGLLPGQQFVFYFHGHANPGALSLNRATSLEAGELQSLLARLPAHARQVIILDACYSGLFLEALKTERRVVITSTDGMSEIWNPRLDNFSNSVMTAALGGMNLLQAFSQAEQAVRQDYLQFRTQKPLLDDNGDGAYGLQDGLLAEQLFIGHPGVPASFLPEILAVHPPLEVGHDGALLWVKTFPQGADYIRAVRARLTQSDDDAEIYRGEMTDFSHYDIELKHNPALARYEAQYKHFPQSGLWRVAYQAFSLDGLWSNIATGEVNVGNFPSGDVQIIANTNQSSYSRGDILRFTLHTENGDNRYYDLYAAIVFPNGDFFTFGYPSIPSSPNVIEPYQAFLKLGIAQEFSILDITVPHGLSNGAYQACGVLTLGGADPWDSANWLKLHCQDLKLQ